MQQLQKNLSSNGHAIFAGIALLFLFFISSLVFRDIWNLSENKALIIVITLAFVFMFGYPAYRIFSAAQVKYDSEFVYFKKILNYKINVVPIKNIQSVEFGQESVLRGYAPRRYLITFKNDQQELRKIGFYMRMRKIDKQILDDFLWRVEHQNSNFAK